MTRLWCGATLPGRRRGQQRPHPVRPVRPAARAFADSACAIARFTARVSRGRSAPIRRPHAGGAPRPGIGYVLRLITSGPAAWQVGIISTLLMFTCAGSATAQATVSAISCGFSGVVPA